MPPIVDQDRFFGGRHDSSTPKHLLQEGTISRLINGRFVEGAISNAVGFDKLEFQTSSKRLFLSNITDQGIFGSGDVQLFAPLKNIAGEFLIVIVSGRIYRLNLSSLEAKDITTSHAFLPATSLEFNHPLSFIDNDGGTSGVGGYLVIFNYPHKPIFINHIEARLSRGAAVFEMPPMRLGATASLRAFTVSGDNLLWISDPLGGANSLAPLTFQETLDPASGFAGQIFSIGSALEIEYITAVCRLPRFSGPSQEFLAHNVLISTQNKKYIIPAGLPRSQWGTSQFITYAGSLDGVAGPHAWTNIGDVLVYLSTTGRIKTIAQDQQRDTSLSEAFLDDPLGQYTDEFEPNFHFREWYRELNHSRSQLKFNRDRLYGTVSPFMSPAIDAFGNKTSSYSHRALAVASLDPRTNLGPQASFSWEGFYDWLNPAGITVIDGHTYVCSKDKYGQISFWKENFTKPDEHTTTIFTRSYFAQSEGFSKSKTMTKVSFYFRRLEGPVKINVYKLINGKWVFGAECMATSKLLRINLGRNPDRTDSWGVPLKIDIDHKGCVFELEGIRVEGEAYRDETT